MFGHPKSRHERVDQIVGDIFGFGRAARREIQPVITGLRFKADAFRPQLIGGIGQRPCSSNREWSSQDPCPLRVPEANLIR